MSSLHTDLRDDFHASSSRGLPPAIPQETVQINRASNPFSSTGNEVAESSTYAGREPFASTSAPPHGSRSREQWYGLEKPTSHLSVSEMESSRQTSQTSSYNGDENSIKKDLGALTYLSLAAPFTSIAVCFYTLFAMLYSILVSPLSLCISKRPSISLHLRSLLRPPHRFQYSCVFQEPCWALHQHQHHHQRHQHRRQPHQASSTTSLSSASSFGPTHANDLSASTLVMIHLLTPVFAGIMAFAAWVVAIFWLFSALTANELEDGGTKRGSEDGRSFLQNLVRWWVNWLDGEMLWGA